MPSAAYNALAELALERGGYVTSRQAQAAGVSSMTLVMMERRGALERVSRGVYRLPHFPVDPRSEYYEASLWPVTVEGIISHESALALYGLSDVSPDRIHVSVPPNLRIRRDIPYSLVIHQADVPDDQWHYFEGIPVTTPVRTILDCHASAAGQDVIRQAIRDGQREGLLRAADVSRLEAILSPAEHPSREFTAQAATSQSDQPLGPVARPRTADVSRAR